VSNIEQPGSRSERILSGVEPISRMAGRQPAVLVADDEAEILDLVTSLMEAEGYLVLPMDKLRRDAASLPVLPKPFDFETLKAKVQALLAEGGTP
jgi:DNA-binding response OmpR family regulator